MLTPTIFRVSATSTTIAINPPISYVAVGSTVAVDINVTDVVNLTSWQFILYFPNSLLSCTNIVEGPFLKTVGGTFFGQNIINNYDSTHGKLLAYATLLGNVVADGSGVLATITFDTLSAGDVSLHLSDTLLGDEKIPPQPIVHTDVDGVIHVQNFTLTVSTTGSGSVSLNNTGPYYHYGEAVQLAAMHDIGWTFDHWIGDLSGFANPATLIITGNMAVTAIFTQDQYSLTVAVLGNGSVSKSPNQATYTWGTNVNLTASANIGYTFAGWSGNASGTANPITVNMTSNMSVTATFFQISYTLTVTTVGNGAVSLNNTGPYQNGDVVLFTAVPSAGWSFDHWSGNLTGSANPSTLIITGNMFVTATFVQVNYTLTVNVVGNGHVDYYDSGSYHYGDLVELTAVPSAGWYFDHWSGNLVGHTSPATLVITSNSVVTATFTQSTYTVNVTIVGGGNIGWNGTGPYHRGDIIVLTAVPHSWWSFDHWSGDLSGSANPSTLIITGNMSVTGTFVQLNYTLAVTPIGDGVVSLNNTGPYHHGDVVLFTAVPFAGWSFDHWSGDLTGSANPTTLTVMNNMSVNATFFRNTYFLSVTNAGSGSVILNNTGPYYYGNVVRLTATPVTGWSFNHWSGNLTGSANPATLTMTSNMSVTATFTQNVYALSLTVSGSGSLSVNNTGPYHYGDAVQLIAMPLSGWAFQYWTGGLSGSANPATLVITCNVSVTAYFIQKPTLQMSPTNKTCHMYGENFTVAINVSSNVNIKGFKFEFHYNSTLLHFVDVTWNLWSSGTISVDETNGNITVSNSGTPINGMQTLITLKFQALFHHVWKSAPTWTNDLTDAIFLQMANVSYPVGPDLHYERGGSSQINVGPDFAYTFSPIPGDVNNDGTVDIYDLRSVAAYFDAGQGDPNWTQASTYDLNGDGVIDVSDLNIVTANYEYTYQP